MNKVRRLAVLALSAGTVFPSVSQAACTQGNATGRWQAIASVFSSTQDWVSCAIIVQANGTIQNTACINDRGQVFNLTQGSVALVDGPSCTFRATFRLGGERERVEMAMARDKNTMTGVGIGPAAGGRGFVLDLVKVDAFPRSDRGEDNLGHSLRPE